MKNWKTQLILTFVGGIVGSALVINIVLWKNDRDFHRIYGPNPGKVEFVTDTGGKGMMMVRDLDNAEEEVNAQFKSDLEFIKSKGITVQAEEESPKITIVKKIPAE